MASHSDESANKRKHVDYDTRCGEERRGYPSREDTPPAQCSVLCGPRSCSTLPSTLGTQNGGGGGGTSPPEPKRRRLWGLRGLVKMFRRRVRRKGGGTDSSESPQAPAPALRARSASELTVDPANRGSGGPYNQGLSVSHDSVFSPESPTEQTHTAPPRLSLATRGVNMSELKEALRRRRGLDSGSVEDDPDDPGLPRSPQTSPTTLDVLNHGLKSSSRGAQSSCSDGSLLSMGSSENDEDSFGIISQFSSKHSLIEGRHQIVDNEPAVGAAPLSHKAARHKISVRPKRTHGIPRARKQSQAQPTSLPTTPEVNEDSSARSERASLNNSFSPYSRPHEGQRPSSVSFSALENQFIKTRCERSEARKSDRKSLPNPPAPSFVHVEDKKEDALLNRLFGSGRAGPPHKLIEAPPTPSPPIQDETFKRIETRLSREKRKDPFKTPPGTKSSRQKSDPSRITYLDEGSSERNNHRSSSVEGRLEGNPLEDHLYPIERPPPPFDVGGIVENEMSYRMDTMDPMKVSRNIEAANRLSASYDSLNEDEIMSCSLTSQSQIGNSLESCEGRSSTDSLTTTPLPGIYIRASQSTTKSRRSSGHSQTSGSVPRFPPEDNYHHLMMQDRENSGPLSLDSSLSLVQQQEEEEVRKAGSAEEVITARGFNLDHHRDFREQIQAPRPVTIMRSVSVHSPASSSRGSSGRSRRSSGGDDLESDSSLPKVSLRKVKREPSLKKPSEEDPTEAVPEFMRIQLNRVQNKGNSVVIFDTEQKVQGTPTGKAIVSVREWSEVSQQNERSEIEKPRDQSEIIIDEKSPIELLSGSVPGMATTELNSNRAADQVEVDHRPEYEEIKSKIIDTVTNSQPTKSKNVEPEATVLQLTRTKSGESDPLGTRPLRTKTNEPERSVANQTVQPPVKISGRKKSIADQTSKEEKEEIILRRPSVVDRSIVIDQSMGALPSSPAAKRDKDEPELFKVFARRSFKLKDTAELDDSLKEEESIDGDKENHIPSQMKDENELTKKTDRGSGNFNAPLGCSSPLTKPTPLKRESVPSSILGTPNPNEPKPTFIVVSGKSSEEVESSSSSVDLRETIKPKPGSTIPYGKSPTSSVSHSRTNSGLDSDGNFSSSSEDNLEIGNKNSRPVNRLKKGHHAIKKPFAPEGSPILSVSPSIQKRKVEEREASSKTAEGGDSANFNSSIIRRSIVAASKVASLDVSESSSTEGEQVVNPKMSPRSQSIVWPPKSQPSSLTDNTEGSSVPVSTPPTSNRFPLPQSKILSSFKDQHTPHTPPEDTEQQQQQVSAESEVIMREKKGRGSIEYRKRSLKEGGPGSPPILAEARNTTFAHSFDSHSSPLTLSYVGKSDSSIKLDRKGSVDEGRNSIGGSAEDWRVLVRQRREDRIKQSKTPDTEEIIIETRPTVSRNSKVLEMANNFQKLQVA